ncbi:NAD(P)/FAD-dependent oxidoreductase [Chryseobacterium sp. Ch-15]|uniref:NAD(P)/FAD-dependent oxidoreductase n=1 Tax=Chryseobacterium muglaense TaxID=2893752 RepID=A0A9Q3UQB0_9FLAO|nr:NAD(P)/FAD-dependent oxidoreductase [Chryseobacterium muglaense]MCC9033023.1 NAD(P)/FAD-dependent oxidoreductase [Chryseobacterium muglaense]MCC9033154.1 NAD(P)/FAD-dependent oxidoreductase [Chryseobacterium muglaense]MCM2557052.1 NAD(P)/FAD-dependent oxidoreductase [Chryseobacterium muglaense]
MVNVQDKCYQFDICVIGAGPAGSSVAIELLKLGYKVCILEKADFPRHHVGICFSQSIFTIANFLGIEEALQKSVLWKRESIHLKWQQPKVIEVEQPGIHVDRGILDLELLTLAKSHGACIFQPVSQVDVLENQTEWIIKCIYDNEQIHIRAQFVVDATGRGGTIFKQNPIKFQPNLLAIHATWKVKSQPSSDGYMEALPDGWSWGAYLGNNTLLLSVYTDAAILKNSDTTIKSYYLDKIKQIESLKGIQLEDLDSKIEVCDASSYYHKNVIGDNYIKIGDAAFTVDPLSSQGVFLALSSAFCVSRTVRTILDATKDCVLAKEFYQNFIKDRVESFKERIPLEYQKVSSFSENTFWKERNNSDAQPHLKEEVAVENIDLSQPFILNPEAKFVTVPILGNDFIEPSLAISLNKKRPIAFVNGVSIIDFLKTYKINKEEFFDFSTENEREKMEIIEHLVDSGIIEDKKSLT